MIAWFQKSPGSEVSQGVEDKTMLLVDNGAPDWVRLPSSMGGAKARVLTSTQAPCPKCNKTDPVRHLQVDARFQGRPVAVAECCRGCGFVWYVKLQPWLVWVLGPNLGASSGGETLVKFEQLKAEILLLRKKAEQNGDPMFLSIPSAWFHKPGPKFRCANDHVSTAILKSSVKGDLCLACNESVMMTFPEDEDGPLPLVQGLSRCRIIVPKNLPSSSQLHQRLLRLPPGSVSSAGFDSSSAPTMFITRRGTGMPSHALG
jgi:hypothetical protein